MAVSEIYLRKGKNESIRRHHPWIFSGAIGRIVCDSDPVEGDVVDVYDCQGEFLARGHFQESSIAVRILSFKKEDFDLDWWVGRIGNARRVREALGFRTAADLTDGGSPADSCSRPTDCYRLVHGEGDNLSGLIVDIYGQSAVIQCHSWGMYRQRTLIAQALKQVFGEALSAIYDKSSQTLPDIGQKAEDGYLFGNTPTGIACEHGHKYLIDWENGQKTGFFLDQRDNRALVERYARGRKVLNTFCYTGGFSVCALAGGAEEVLSIDASEKAIALADRNVELNFGKNCETDSLAARHHSMVCDAVEYLKTMDDSFDLIILDPPAFAKHHRVSDEALKGYRRINARALSHIRPGGILFTFSCSQAISKEMFHTQVFSAAAIAGRKVRVLHQLTQAPDHPVNIYHPEGEYLKGLVLYVE